METTDCAQPMVEGTQVQEPAFDPGSFDRAGRHIRVVHFTRSPLEGGFSVERIFEDVREALPGNIHVRVVPNAHPNKGFIPRLMNALAARRHRSEVNHVLGDTQYLASFLPRARTILTVLDCVSLERLSGWRRWVLWFFWYWWPLKRAAHVTVLSDFTRQSLLSCVRYPAGGISVIPPPLSSEFSPSPPRPFESWSRLLHIGVAPHKNLARVIEAAAGLDVTLVIIGRLPRDIEALILKRGLRFESHHDLDRVSLADQYRKADMLVFASTYEGWGMPIVEAHAIGRPVVTSIVASMPEAAGNAACLVDPFDVSSIRAGICRILEDEAYARELIAAGFENARRYSADTIARRYADVYWSVSAKNRSAMSSRPADRAFEEDETPRAP